jgi:hypothetical protein
MKGCSSPAATFKSVFLLRISVRYRLKEYRAYCLSWALLGCNWGLKTKKNHLRKPEIFIFLLLVGSFLQICQPETVVQQIQSEIRSQVSGQEAENYEKWAGVEKGISIGKFQKGGPKSATSCSQVDDFEKGVWAFEKTSSESSQPDKVDFSFLFARLTICKMCLYAQKKGEICKAKALKWLRFYKFAAFL